MNQPDWLAERFEENRDRLRAVAYRMLGSAAEAEDAVQEAWLRLTRSDSAEITNLGGWLTTVVGRVCLDMLRSRKGRREESISAQPSDPPAGRISDPEHEVLLADAVGLALLVVLDRLSPAERVSFVLHDLFAIPFEEIAPVLGRSAVAVRQLASRARRRIHGQAMPVSDEDRRHLQSTAFVRQRRLVESFLAALRAGDVQALVSLLDPDFAIGANAVASPAIPKDIGGAENWARQAINSAQGAAYARPALINGLPGLLIAPHGKLFRVLTFVVREGRIAQVDIISERAALDALNLGILPD